VPVLSVALSASVWLSVLACLEQEDIMMRELTVRDNIAFSARVRLPPSWDAASIDQHVDAVLDALALAHVQVRGCEQR